MKRQPQKEGVALLVVLGYMAAITIFSGIFLSMVHIALESRNHTNKQAETRILAESGVHYAVARIRENADFAGEQAHQLGDGAFTVSVTTTPSKDRMITSTGFLPADHHQRYPFTVTARVANIDGKWVPVEWNARPGLSKPGIPGDSQ